MQDMYYIIKGTFIIARHGLGPYTPDGDTIRFQADDPELISSLPQRGDAPKNPASIRFEAIDALEKDQEEQGAKASRDRVFDLLGLGQHSLSLGSDGFQVLSANLGENRGCILANTLDKYGRVIAFVILKELSQPDGTLIDAGPGDIASSVNRSLIVEGLVYPTFYSTLPAKLRSSLTQDALAARMSTTAASSIWDRAAGMPGSPAIIRSSSKLADLVLFPTLHRRLVSYLKNHSNFDNFADWVRSDNERRNKTVHILANDTYTDLAGILHMNGQEIGLKYNPEEFVFVDGPQIVVDPVDTEPIAVGDVMIVGVLANAVGSVEQGSEVITLLNRTKSVVSLTGWSLRDNAGSESLTGLIPAGHTVRVVPQILQLSNQADRVELCRPDDGAVVDQVEWSSGTVEGRTMVFSWPRS